MTYYLEDQPAIATWDELRPMAPRTGVYDKTWRVVLQRGAFIIFVLEPPGAWRARHRRALHRMGFRRRQGVRTVWEWTPPEDAVRDETVRMFTKPATTPGIHRLRASLARDRLLDARCVVVLRDVFGLTPADLHVAVLVEDEDEDWDEVG